jgi:hypothetical protein
MQKRKTQKASRSKRGAAPRRVSFEENDDDFICAVLCLMGYSTQCIVNSTGLTPGQVTYRVTSAGLQWARHNFRNGTSKQAKSALQEYLGMERTTAEGIAMVLAEELDAPRPKGKKLKPKGTLK